MPPPADPRQPVGREPRAEAEHVPHLGYISARKLKSAAFTQPWVSELCLGCVSGSGLRLVWMGRYREICGLDSRRVAAASRVCLLLAL